MKYFLVIFFSFTAIIAQSSASKTGSFTRLGQSAYQLSMGNSGIAAEANGASFYYNPSAVLFSETKTILGANVQQLSLDRNVYSLGFSKLTKRGAQLSMGWIHAGVDDLYEYNSEAVKGEELNFGMNAFYASFGVKIGTKLGISFTGKYLTESLTDYYKDDYKASGFSLDISTIYILSNKTQIAFVVRDLSGKITTNSDKVFGESSNLTAFEIDQKLPKYMIVGVQTSELFEMMNFYHFEQNIDLKVMEDKTVSIHTGIEYNGFENGSLRAGLDKNHINAGLGLNFMFGNKRIVLDYAFVSSFYSEGESHIFSWSMELN